MTNTEQIAAMAERIEKLEGALESAIGDILWMSAASDFHPGSVAHKGWKKVRDKIKAYDALLSSGDQG